jgi:acyl-coenzyme A thioesterase PaaI-like protein
MEEKNDYGMYSGGYIFDQMDRAALFYVKTEGNLPDNAVIVTQAVDGLRFKRQLCDKYNVTVHCFDFHVIELFSKLYTCKAEVLDNKGELVAEADFTFTEATNHCEIVGRQ